MDILPIDAFVPAIAAAVRDRRAVVVTAAPGAGKTTRVPPALVADGPVLLLQPRRVAARAIARRIASEREWTIGREVGWQVRFERRFSEDTRLLVATEGVLTARLQDDPLLSGFRTVVIDEFHERSIHADLGLAMTRQAWLARSDLRIVIMSATINAARVSAFLDNCPVIDVPGRLHPVEVRYAPGVVIERAVIDHLPARGAVLCFLPGAPEIRQAADQLRPLVPPHTPVLPLHGSLDADEQDAVLMPSDGRRIILATNLAETTVTVPDVVAVIDTGLHKVARYDADRGIDSLETERISLDSADQRAGRAGRTQSGVAVRLWDARDRLKRHRDPEILRVDLAPVLMDVMAWGGDPFSFEWLDPPRADAVQSALDLLDQLGALDRQRRLTPLGRRMNRLPLHPRLARLLIAAHGAPVAARACALLSERHFVPPASQTTACDLLAAVEQPAGFPWHIARVADDIRRTAAASIDRTADAINDADFRRAVLAGYPDRVARRRQPNEDRFLLASGTGARLARTSGVYDAEFVVAVDVSLSASGRAAATSADPLIRVATGIERDWLVPTHIEIVHELDAETGVVRAWAIDRYGAIALGRQPAPVDQEAAAALISAAYLERGGGERDVQLLQRLAFAGIEMTRESLVAAASRTARRLGDVDLAAHVPPGLRRDLDRLAPVTFQLPAGRTVRLRYESDIRVVAATRLQDVIGLTVTPRLGARQVPLTFELLAPSGRPVQVTNDLQSFWTRTYPELRTQLRTRYPKHNWP